MAFRALSSSSLKCRPFGQSSFTCFSPNRFFIRSSTRSRIFSQVLSSKNPRSSITKSPKFVILEEIARNIATVYTYGALVTTFFAWPDSDHVYDEKYKWHHAVKTGVIWPIFLVFVLAESNVDKVINEWPETAKYIFDMKDK
jgi:hypothetical protein